MSGAASLDLRIPIGGLFTTLGVLLGGYGLATAGDAQRYAPSGGMNINLVWGVVLLLVGVVFLFLARRGSAAMHTAAETPEGRATEKREHELGLER
jgi:hypothetical protein